MKAHSISYPLAWPVISRGALLGLGLVAGALTACAASSDTGGGSSAGSGGSGDTVASTGGAGPGDGGMGGNHSGGGQGGGDCGTPDGALLALEELFLGDTDFSGQTNADAWKAYGFDIDGVTTTTDFSAHCQPYAGAVAASVFTDGNDGIDNSFGKNVLPALSGYVPNMSATANMSIDDGEFSLILLIEGLQPSTDMDPLTSKIYGGANLGSAPLWDGSDCWPVSPGSLTDPNDITTASVTFDASAVSDGVWASNGTATLVLPITIGGYSSAITIYQARLSTPIAPGLQGAAQGQIGGVIDTEEFVEIVRDVAGTIGPSYCQGALFNSLALEIRQASDVMKDGTQDPNSTCDGISAGLGFNMLGVKLGGIAEAESPPVDPCN